MILKITLNQIVKLILKRMILKITPNQKLKITLNQILKLILKEKILKITPNQILKITMNQILKIILKRKILKITPNQILKITANQILNMTSNGILMILGHLEEKNQISIRNRYKSLLETKKTIKNNIDSIYSALKKLPNESLSKANELIRLDTILNDSINVIWREIHDRDKKKVIKKINKNKIKNVDSLYELKAIINHKILLLKTSVIVKLNVIINDIKNISNIDDVYNYSNKDKIFMIYNNLEKYTKHLKRDLGTIK